MIVVHVEVKVNPPDRAAFLEQAASDTTRSRQFAGNLAFAWSEDLSAAGTYVLYEEWESVEHFDAYKNSDEFKVSGGKLFPLFSGEPKTAYYTATRS